MHPFLQPTSLQSPMRVRAQTAPAAHYAALLLAADAFANTERSKNGFFFSDVLCELGSSEFMG